MQNETMLHNPRFWVAVAFVIFFVIFGRKLWAAVSGLLDARAELIRTELAAARLLRQEAEAMLRDAAARRADALADAKSLLESAHHEAARLAAAATAEAATAATRRERMALDRIAAAEKAAIDAVRLTATDIATAAAEQVIRTQLSHEAATGLVDKAISDLPSALRAA